MVETEEIESRTVPCKDTVFPVIPSAHILAESRGVEPHPISENPVFKAGRRTNAAALLSITLVDQRGIEPRTPACKAGVFPIIPSAHIGLGGKNRTSDTWSQTTNFTIKLHRVKSFLVVIEGNDPSFMPYEGSTHPSTSYHQ